MAAYRELHQLFGRVPASIDDERFIDAWVEASLAITHRYGLS
jgi:hypothetical protein